MSLIHELEPTTERERATLIARHIMPDPTHPGLAHYRLRAFGIAVWALVAYYEAVGHDLARVAEDYDLPIDHVRAALAFYAEYSAAIDAYLSARRAV